MLRAKRCFLARLSYSAIARDERTSLPAIKFTMKNTGRRTQVSQVIFQVMLSMDVTMRLSRKGPPTSTSNMRTSESLAAPEHWEELKGHLSRVNSDCSDKIFSRILEECYIHWVRFEKNRHTIGLVVTRHSAKGEKLMTDGRLSELYEKTSKSEDLPVRNSSMGKAYILLAYTIEKEDSLALNSESLKLQNQALTMKAPYATSFWNMM